MSLIGGNKDRQQVLADFQSQVAICRTDPEQMGRDLSMAIGILLSGGYPGCAAAVAVLTQTHTDEPLDYYIGPKP